MQIINFNDKAYTVIRKIKTSHFTDLGKFNDNKVTFYKDWLKPDHIVNDNEYFYFLQLIPEANVVESTPTELETVGVS